MDDSSTDHNSSTSSSTSSSSSVGFDIPARAKSVASAVKKSIWKNSDRENAKTCKNKMSTKDFDLKKEEFSKWLLEEKKVLLSMLNEKRRKVMFKKFVSKWNKRKLPTNYYRETGSLWIAMSPFSPALKQSHCAIKPSILTLNGSTSVLNNTFLSTSKYDKSSKMSTRSSKTSFLNNTFSSATNQGTYDPSPTEETRGSKSFLNDTFMSTLTRGKSAHSSRMSLRGAKADLNSTISSTMKRGKYDQTPRVLMRGSKSALNSSFAAGMTTRSNKHANNRFSVLGVDGEFSPSLFRTRSSKFSALQSTRDLRPISDDLLSISRSPCARATPARPHFGTFGKKSGARVLNELRAQSVIFEQDVVTSMTGVEQTSTSNHFAKPETEISRQSPACRMRVKNVYGESSTVL